MHIIESIKQAFTTFLEKQYDIAKKTVTPCALTLNVDEQKQAFGDLNSSAPLILAKQLKQAPRAIAESIASEFKNEYIQKIEIAGPGFLNFFLTQHAYDLIAQELFNQKENFFKPTTLDTTNVNIEFVSANPTGPLHFGHGRGGIIGDVLGNVLKFMGHNVTKEFYINDAGAQIGKLGNSLKIRYQQKAGMDVDLPVDGYQGTYLLDLANNLIAEHGNKLLDQPTEFFASYAKEALLKQIQSTLADYGISFDTWFSEKTLHNDGSITKAIETLNEKGHLFEADDALWFRSTTFGDDKDRVVKKKDGNLTYAAADIAYISNKVGRGHNRLIYILGHDHHSYATRLKGLMQALGHEIPLDVILYQLVSMKKGEQAVRMSKRAGAIVTLQDIIKTVGKDVARYFYLNRKNDAQLEFDLDLALKHSDENPVYYIQYAYVRTNSIMEKAAAESQLNDCTAKDLVNLTPEDDALLRKIVTLRDTLATIEQNNQTHLLAYYALELAQSFNRYYNKNRVIDLSNIPQSRARLAVVKIVHETLALCLDLLGLSKPERM